VCCSLSSIKQGINYRNICCLNGTKTLSITNTAYRQCVLSFINASMLSVMLSVILLSVIMLNVMAPQKHIQIQYQKSFIKLSLSGNRLSSSAMISPKLCCLSFSPTIVHSRQMWTRAWITLCRSRSDTSGKD